jgi:hypothetical protein
VIPDLILGDLFLVRRRLVVRLYGPPKGDLREAFILTTFAELDEFTRMPRPRGQRALPWTRPMDLNLRT